MLRKHLIILILLVLTCPGVGQANSTALISLDLSLAGYRLGMSLDDVALVRPIDYVKRAIREREDSSTFYALADHAYVDGAAVDLLVSFKNEKTYKIIARISPVLFENVAWNIQQSLGAGQNKSKNFKNSRNENIHETVYLWEFPNARIHLVKVSSNTEFMTISLTEKRAVE